MKFGRLNIITGGVVIFVAGVGGFALGKTLESNFNNGIYAMTLVRTLLRAGHSHGMPFAFYNLIVGLLVDRLELTDTWKKRCSILAIMALFMPVGLALRGAFGGSEAFEPVAMLGAFSFLASAGIIIKGAMGIKAS